MSTGNDKSFPRISVLGCGWLGLPLAIRLSALGYSLKGSTTTPEKLGKLTEAGISPFLIEFSPAITINNGDVAKFFESDILILTIPFRRNLTEPSYYQKQIQSIIDQLENSSTQFVILTSSTSVYPRINQSFSEQESFVPENERARVLLTVEKMLMESRCFQSTVLRLGGLYGRDRQLGKFLDGKSPLSDGHSPVNLLHLDDAVEVISEVIRQDVRGEIFNVCSDEHPTRQELYTAKARMLGLPDPVFIPDAQKKYKIIKNDHLKKGLGYTFRHPSPLYSAS